jgi:hypothetical protein
MPHTTPLEQRWGVPPLFQPAGRGKAVPGCVRRSKEIAGSPHEEFWLVSELQLRAGTILPQSFPVIGVSQTTICGTCLEKVFGQEGAIERGEVAYHAEVPLLPLSLEITVEAVGYGYGR